MPTYRGFVNLYGQEGHSPGVLTTSHVFSNREETARLARGSRSYLGTVEVQWYEPFERVGYELVSGTPSQVVGMRPLADEFKSPVAGGGYPAIPYDEPVDLVPLTRATERPMTYDEARAFGCL